MSRPGRQDELTFILGPPVEPSQRLAFEDYLSAVEEGRDEEVRRYEALEKEFLEEIFVGGSSEEPSAFAELLGEALQTQARLRRVTINKAFMKGLWVCAATIHGRDLDFSGPVVRFPPDKETCEALAASLGLVLKREWMLSFSAT